MECPCPVCTQRLFGRTENKAMQEAYEVAPLEPDTTVERLTDLVQEFYDAGSPDTLIEKLDSIIDELDSFNDELVELQTICIMKSIDHTQFQLGELSRKLY